MMVNFFDLFCIEVRSSYAKDKGPKTTQPVEST